MYPSPYILLPVTYNFMNFAVYSILILKGQKLKMKLLQYKHIEGSTYGFLSFFGRKTLNSRIMYSKAIL